MSAVINPPVDSNGVSNSGASGQNAQLANGDCVILLTGRNVKGGGTRVYSLVGATGDFRLYGQISPDAGTTWYTVDDQDSRAGRDSTYLRCAKYDNFLPGIFRLLLCNVSGVAIDWIASTRTFEESAQ